MKFVDGNVFVQKMSFHAFHGVMAQERKVGGEFTVDVTINVDVSKAINTDIIADTIDYGEIYQTVKKEMEESSLLVERVACRIAEALFAKFPQAKDIGIRITKVNPPLGADCLGAGVEIHFSNE